MTKHIKGQENNINNKNILVDVEQFFVSVQNQNI